LLKQKFRSLDSEAPRVSISESWEQTQSETVSSETKESPSVWSYDRSLPITSKVRMRTHPTEVRVYNIVPRSSDPM